VIEPSPKNGGGLTGVLRCPEYDYRLGWSSFIARAPDEYRAGGDDPERKCRHDYDRQYSANEVYGLFCLGGSGGGGALHQWKLR
jgi:hypothetical protein